MWRFETSLAWRHLLSGGGQTVLIVLGVAMAVTLVVFISGLIYGLQQRIIQSILGQLPLITVQRPEPVVRVPTAIPGYGGAVIISQESKRATRRRRIEQWRQLERELSRLTHVRAVSPEITEQAILVYEGNEAGVTAIGVVPAQRDMITHVSSNMVEGDFLNMDLGDAVIGYDLAQDEGIGIGDRIRLLSSTGNSAIFRVAGIYFTQQGLGGGGTVYITLRAAQTLFNLGTAITTLSLTLDDLYQANNVADQIQASYDLEAESWMRQIPQIMTAFRAQSSTALLISAFSLIAAGFGIASVLIVSVLKRSREIGILKAMGARRAQVLRIFTLEGLGIAIIGAALGALFGSGLVLAVRLIKQPPNYPGQPPEPLLPAVITPGLIALAIGAAIVVTIVGSVLPARQAARLDPVEVIQRG